MNKEQVLNVKETAEYLGVTTVTLCKWRTIGHPAIPFHKIGNKIMYKQSDLDKYFESTRNESGKTQ